MTLTELAKKHGVSVESLESELEAGLEVEREHYSDTPTRRKIAMDHLEEIPDYYTRLKKMESKAKGESKEQDEEDEAQERSNKAYDTWAPTAVKSDNKPLAVSENEIYYPQVDLKLPKCEFKVGEDVEVTFKACVKRLEQSKDGHRVSFELKEFKL